MSNDEIINKALNILKRRMRSGRVLTSSAATKHYLRLQLAPLEHEVFAVVFLNNQHKVLAFDEMFRGTVDGAVVHPREVVKRALEHNACAVIFAHNHPGGVAEPSIADKAITKRLTDALKLVEIRVLDHFVVTCGECYSFAEKGLI